LTDDTNQVFFADDHGNFPAYRFTPGGHYEVQGSGTGSDELAPQRPSTSSLSTPPSTAFNFATRSSPSVGNMQLSRVQKKAVQRLVPLISRPIV
jgi:hypothetical protein